ncbi:MAG: UvrD-helicase domain-containing protein [Synergistaceae bacterium]|jgi:ATP-dependent exoDNAse (exonuclease V) beta subunit|nr:UvrD-helicase domain-containing protein [Synergistaceae bacterium]
MGMTPTTTNELEAFISDARPEQRQAICSLDPWIVVSAGAGTGKTRTLANRFAWLLASDPECRVDEILTLTFTNAAAAEMRERIRNTLKTWHAAGVSHLKDSIDRLDEAYISTIHSFALRVIRESGVLLDIDPDSRIVDEPMEHEFREDLKWRLQTDTLGRMTETLRDVWGEYARSLREDPSNISMLNYYGADAFAKLGNEACNVFGSMNRRPEDLMDPGDEAELAAQRRVARVMSNRWSETWDAWQLDIFPSLESELRENISGAKFPQTVKGFYDRWSGAERTPESERLFFVSLITSALGSLPGKERLKSAIEDMLGCPLKTWRDERKSDAVISSTLFNDPMYGETERRTKNLLRGVTSLFWECWDETRKTRGALSFSDFVRYAGRILAINPLYSGRFRHVMIDEFQDTDELQDGIIRSIAKSGPEKPGAARTIFIVGDIKQSVYRFRHANPRLFAGYMKSSAPIGMSRSFRMSGRLMNSVNMVFGHIWRDGVLTDDDVKIAYEPLLPPEDAPWWSERNGKRAPASPMEILVYTPIPPTEDNPIKENAGTQRKKLASAAASRLWELMRDEAEIWDKDNQSFRKLGWKDITILVRGRTPYPQIEEAFGEAGVPVVFNLGREYLNRGEVRDLACFLRALDMPDDEQALAGWLESPFSGMEPGVVHELINAAKDRRDSLRAVFYERYPESASRLERFRGSARLYSPSRAVGMLLEDDSWLACYREDARGRALANIRRGFELLRGYEASCGISLSACADYLRREMRSGAAVDEPETASNDRDAVRVMTIHASKGLEFPVVLLMYMESSANVNRNRSARAMVSRSLGVVASKLPDGNESARKMWHDAIERSEEFDENSRLLYVAMTRAQERLICCGLPAGRNKNGLDWLSCVIGANEANGNPMPLIEATDDMTGGENTASSSDRPDDPPPPDCENHAIFPAPSAAMLSATAYSLLSWCPSAYRIRYRQGRELKWEKYSGGGAGGADLGSLVHWALSRWNFDPSLLDEFFPDDITEEKTSMALTEIAPRLRPVWRGRSNRRAARQWLESFALSDSCEELRRAHASGALVRELAFSVDCGVNLVGSIDVFWEDERGCHVRDWKITPEESAPHELYTAQLDFYAMACHIARRAPRVDAGLIYLRPSEESVREVRAIENWDELSDLIRKSAVHTNGPFKNSPQKCEMCPFSSHCAEKFISHTSSNVLE